MKKSVEITMHCSMCSEDFSITIELPSGWAMKYYSIDEEHAFCPKHAKVADFLDDQCSGCVSGWGECGLYESIMYPNYPKRQPQITEDQLETVRGGLCPVRINGTFGVNVTEQGVDFKDEDLSERAGSEAGEAFVKAILDYRERWGNEHEKNKEKEGVGEI